MSDREKVKWLQVLLAIWGSAFVPLLLMAWGAPAAVEDGPRAIGGVLLYEAIVTLTYLLILSWRAAYLSGRSKK